MSFYYAACKKSLEFLLSSGAFGEIKPLFPFRIVRAQKSLSGEETGRQNYIAAIGILPAWLDKHYSDFAPGKSTVEKWFAKFKRGEMSTENDARSGHPKEAVTDENITKVHKIIFGNHKVKLVEIAKTLKISKECVGHIVNEYLDMRKLCSKWVPRELTIDQKQQRIDDSKQCLELFNRN
ncbi:putative mariner transposase [Trichonephila clavipes]|nr:putative mariner transposase [Trichonephila clavipes]